VLEKAGKAGKAGFFDVLEILLGGGNAAIGKKLVLGENTPVGGKPTHSPRKHSYEGGIYTVQSDNR